MTLHTSNLKLFHVDVEDACEGWAATGECARNADYMMTHCARSCGKCAPRGTKGDKGQNNKNNGDDNNGAMKSETFIVRDVWARKNLGSFAHTWSSSDAMAPHACVMLRLHAAGHAAAKDETDKRGRPHPRSHPGVVLLTNVCIVSAMLAASAACMSYAIPRVRPLWGRASKPNRNVL